MTERLLLTAALLFLIAAIMLLMIKAPVYMTVMLLVGAFGCGVSYLNFKNKKNM